MNTRRSATTNLYRSVVLAGCVAAWPAAIGLAGSETAGPAAPLADASGAPIADANTPAETASVPTTDGRGDAKPAEGAQIETTDNRTLSNAAPSEAPQLAATGDDTVSV